MKERIAFQHKRPENTEPDMYFSKQKKKQPRHFFDRVSKTLVTCFIAFVSHFKGLQNILPEL
jgi:hypothetical protein